MGLLSDMEKAHCLQCQVEMLEIGNTGSSRTIISQKGKIIGIQSEKLYQCPKCKKVIIN